MALPIHTTLITISRGTPGDAFDRGDPSVVASGVRAHIGAVGGTETVTAGSSETRTAHLAADPCDLRHGDIVTDETTGTVYEVTYAAQIVALGLDHVSADVLVVTDRAAV